MKICIGIPAFKAFDTIEECISSINIQSMRSDINVIIANDEPEDNGKYNYLSEKFKISKEASENCIHILGKVIDNEFITTDYDDIIIQLFKPYISIDYSYDSYFDELEDRRKSFNFSKY